MSEPLPGAMRAAEAIWDMDPWGSMPHVNLMRDAIEHASGLRELVEWIDKHGCHPEECELGGQWRMMLPVCTCGLSDALAKVKGGDEC